MKNVNWVKNNNNNEWYDFLKLDYNANYFSNKKGVYVIWYTSPSVAKVIRLGQGNIGERLREHIDNPEIRKYSRLGTLKVSWIVVGENQLTDSDLDGVEYFLSTKYTPIIGERFPETTPVVINLITG